MYRYLLLIGLWIVILPVYATALTCPQSYEQVNLHHNHDKISINKLQNWHKDRQQILTSVESYYLHDLYLAIYGQNLELLWLAYSNLSDLLAMEGYTTAAIFWRKQAVNALQNIRLCDAHNHDRQWEQNTEQNKSETYIKLADLLMKQGRLPEAQQILTMLKEERYFEFVERDSLAANLRTTKELYNSVEQVWINKYNKLHQVILELYQQLDLQTEPNNQLIAELKNVDIGFQNYFAELYSASSKIDIQDIKGENYIQLQQIQLMLAESQTEAVLIHYLLTDDKLRIMLTTADKQIATETNITRIELNRKILHFHQLIQSPLQNSLAAAQDLYNYIIKPIAADLALTKAKILMLSLDSTLYYIPFAALHDGKRYLIENYAIVSYNEIVQQPIQKTPKQDWRIVGLGVSEAIAGFNPLPTVITELSHIVREHEQDENGIIAGKLFLNDDFSEQKLQELLQQDYTIMHIASHFVFNPGTQKDSYLLLGRGKKLTLDKIRRYYRFDNLELLTLSACDTAIGSLATGREIEGFAALAQHQGARSIIASLWPVHDESTGHFMQLFYRLYVQEHINKAQALQQAQLSFIYNRYDDGEYRQDYPYYYAEPYYWAAFVLMGNW